MTDEKARKNRWRLVLGPGSEDTFGAVEQGIWSDRERMLAFLYDREYGSARNIRRDKDQSRQGGLDDSILTVPDWINGVHELFPQKTIERIEKDALERYQLDEMVTNPEVLARAQPSQVLLKAVLRTKHLMNEQVLAVARELVRKAVNELIEKLAREVRSPFTGSRDRRRRSFQKVAKNLDTKTTIQRNLKHYNPKEKKLYIETPYFYSRIKRQVDRWQIIIVVDESGSMMDSVIHSAVTASIFYTMKSLKTHLVIFDTSIVDLTDECSDPVETLMKVQLGGGTDIGNAVRYASQIVDNPRRCIVVLITDFEEGAPLNQLYSAAKQLLESGVQLIGLAALDERAKPAYNHEVAQNLANMGAHVGAMTPGELAAWVAEKIL